LQLYYEQTRTLIALNHRISTTGPAESFSPTVARTKLANHGGEQLGLRRPQMRHWLVHFNLSLKLGNLHKNIVKGQALQYKLALTEII